MKTWLLIFALILISFAVRAKAFPVSDHYNGKIFYNPGQNQLLSFWEVLKWKMNGSASIWPDHVANKNYTLPKIEPSHRAIITFVNHATFLIQLKNLTILTDPMFSNRAGPFSFMGPARVREPGIRIDELPPIDVVVISHNHYDHLDLESLKILDAKFHPLFLAPLGDRPLLEEAGLQNIQELDWWDERVVKQTKIVFTPAQHWSARGLFDKCKSLWGSYFIQSQEFKAYFGGDTGYSSHFAETQKRLGSPDAALLPIGAYSPDYLMQINHMNPEEAIQAHKDLKAIYSFGMHFGTFPLTDESINEPVERLRTGQIENFLVLDHGESKVF